MMQAFVESGHAVLIAIGFVIIEIIMIVILRRRRAASIVIGVAPGLCLMLALLSALEGSDWQAIIFWVTLSLPFHLIDLRSRLRSE